MQDYLLSAYRKVFMMAFHERTKPQVPVMYLLLMCFVLFSSWWFNVGVILLGICLALAMFCIVYLEWFKGIQHYDHEYPAIPPITTAAFLAASCR